jgi:hypothetical protein
MQDIRWKQRFEKEGFDVKNPRSAIQNAFQAQLIIMDKLPGGRQWFRKG